VLRSQILEKKPVSPRPESNPAPLVDDWGTDMDNWGEGAAGTSTTGTSTTSAGMWGEGDGDCGMEDTPTSDISSAEIHSTDSELHVPSKTIINHMESESETRLSGVGADNSDTLVNRAVDACMDRADNSGGCDIEAVSCESGPAELSKAQDNIAAVGDAESIGEIDVGIRQLHMNEMDDSSPGSSSAGENIVIAR
jgi:hypothetical protein